MLPKFTTPYVVYQYLDQHGDTLYVGVTSTWLLREETHRRQAHWFPLATETRTTAYATPEDAAEAESALITATNPRYNRDRDGTSSKRWRSAASSRYRRRMESEEAAEAMAGDGTPTLSLDDAAKRAGVSGRSIRNWIKWGHIKAFYDEKGVRHVPLESLDAYLASRRITPATPGPLVDEGARPVVSLEAYRASRASLEELSSALAKALERNETLQKQNTELEWRNGYLSAQNEHLKGQVKQLEPGPEEALSAEETPAETLPTEAPPWWDLPGRIRRSRWYNS